MRHRRCRKFALSSVHGFALRASPAVKHGVSPPGTVGDNVGILSSIPSLHIVYALADTLVLYFADRHFSMVCMLLRIPSPTAPPPHPHLHRAASGGGAPCLTAGDARTIVRANPWRSGQTTALPSDTGGVALTALREYSSSLLLRKYSILLSRVITLITDMFSISYMQSVTT